MKRPLLYVTVFTGGMTTLAVEMAASRLLGAFFGTSNLVWAAIIGLILVYLTAGYFIGGRWADRSRSPATFYTIAIMGAFLCGAIPLVAHPVLTAAANALYVLNAGVVAGAFIAVLVLFSVPVTLLGCISPFAIRLAADDLDQIGRVSGRLSALSTLGSIIGTFASVLILIPEAGTRGTFLIFAALLMLVALIGLAIFDRRRALILAALLPILALLHALAAQGPVKPPPPNAVLLEERESAYNTIQVVQTPDESRYLLLNEGQGIHSQYHPDAVWFGRTWGYFMAAPYFNAPPHPPERVESLALIGLAAGTIARQYDVAYGPIPVDGIEIDPAIIELGFEYFEMDTPGLNAIAADGRAALRMSERRYSVVGIDAYRVPYIPWHLTTVEFFREVRDHLSADGVAVINVGRSSSDRRLVDALANTLLHVFPSVHAMDVPNAFNTILVATMQPTQPENIAANLPALEGAPAILYNAAKLAAETLVPVTPSDVLFTDDHAPVETITDGLVIDFLLGGQIDALRREN